MDAIEFIESDVSQGSAFRKRRAVFATLFLICVTAALGLGIRENMDGAFDLRVLIPNLVASLSLALVTGRYFRSQSISKWTRRALILFVILLLATDRLFLPLGERTHYATSSVFWRESLRCFTKGTVAAAIASLGLLVIAFNYASLPFKEGRIFLAFISGLAATVMLGFHCDSSSFGHVFTGHIIPGLMIGALTYFIENRIFRRKVQRVLGGPIENLEHLG